MLCVAYYEFSGEAAAIAMAMAVAGAEDAHIACSSLLLLA